MNKCRNHAFHPGVGAAEILMPIIRRTPRNKRVDPLLRQLPEAPEQTTACDSWGEPENTTVRSRSLHPATPSLPQDLSVDRFLSNGFDLLEQLAAFLELEPAALQQRLPSSNADLAALHPGAFDPQTVEHFYEETVGDAHLLELAGWHLGSATYIADTLRLQAEFARGQVLDFGGGIGTHALAAAALPEVEKVWCVDLNPRNREFVSWRAGKLGLAERISCHRDLTDPALPARFDTIVCLDVLEHLKNPAGQLVEFAERLSPNGIALLNWYFFRGHSGEYPFHQDDPELVEEFFLTLQAHFLEVFHPWLITTRAYRLMP